MYKRSYYVEMKKDIRQLPPEIQQYNRQPVIRMYQQGISRKTITLSQMQLPSALWPRQAIQVVMWQMWRIKMAKRTFTDHLKHWGITPQKPLKRASEQSPKVVKKWQSKKCDHLSLSCMGI
ncbi:helix-turn-helix domain-containing protein [Photorhabdus bodei]|uniref:helix-turn-helix domain-containing protein n=2 Tax=Photorhabdus bodei TaxID=2029681 RepID=UPI003A7F3B91|nr:winged helix-turn-helix domain-containing protein [Photorhabdus bodei]